MKIQLNGEHIIQTNLQMLYLRKIMFPIISCIFLNLQYTNLLIQLRQIHKEIYNK